MAPGLERVSLARQSNDLPIGQWNLTGISRLNDGADKPDEAVAPQSESRSLSEVASDTGHQLAKGVMTTAGAVPNLVAPESDIAKLFNDTAKFYDDQQSETMKALTAAASDKISRARQTGEWDAFTTALAEYSTSPALFSKLVMENAASLIPGLGVAKGAQVLAKGAALARGAQVARAAQMGATAGTVAGGATNALLNGGGARQEAFSDWKQTLMANGMSEEEATQTAIEKSRVAAGIGMAAGAVSGATGLERGVVSALKNGGVKGFATGAASEFGGEILEELAPKAATNVQIQSADPARAWNSGLGETAAQTMVASSPGAVLSGAAHAQRTADEIGGAAPTISEGTAVQPYDPVAPERPRDGGVSGEYLPAEPNPALPNSPGTGATYNQTTPSLPPGQPLLSGPQPMEGDVLSAESLPQGQQRLPYPAIDGESRQDVGLPRQMLDQPTERQSATARGLLNHSPRPSPDLLQRLMRIDADTAVQLFRHWQQKNGAENDRKSNSLQDSQASTQSGNGQGADMAGGAAVGSQLPDSVSSAMGNATESATASVQADVAVPATGTRDTVEKPAAKSPPALSRSSANRVAQQLSTNDIRYVAAPHPTQPGMFMVASEEDAKSVIPAITVQDVQAHAAATSPYNATPQPTDAQKQAGNYRKGHIKFDSMDISIENPSGSKRTGKGADGKAWETDMQHHYGYLKGTVGADKDHLDVFIKPGAETSKSAYVIDQIDPKSGKFDEHKIILGADSEQEAKAIYHANYQQGWQGMGEITAMPMADFKTWIKSGNTTKPLAYQAPKEVRIGQRKTPSASSLLQAIVNRGGISRDIMSDVGADPAARYMPGLFTANGTSDLSSLAQYLFDEDGFHQIPQGSDIGPARELEELISRAITGEKILSTAAMEKTAQAEDDAKLRAEAKQAGIKTVARKLSDIKRDYLQYKEKQREATIAKLGEKFARTLAIAQRVLASDTVDNAVENAGQNVSAPDLYLGMRRNLIKEMLDARRAQRTDGSGAGGVRRADQDSGNVGGRGGHDGDGLAASPGNDSTEGSAERPGFKLDQQTEAQARAADEKRKADEAQRLKDDQAVDNKRKADAERNTFSLTGSDRSADVLAAQGQGGLFDAPSDAIAGKPVVDMSDGMLNQIAKSSQPAAAKAKKEVERRAQAGAGAYVQEPKAKIGDFGEKIGGAKKDVWGTYKDAMDNAEKLDVNAEPLSKSWPAPDYQAMIDSGADPWIVAFIRSMRDEVPSKPRVGYKLKTWAKLVTALRGHAQSALNGTLPKEGIMRALAENRMSHIIGRMELYEAVGHKQSLDGFQFGFHHYTLYKGEKDVSLWSVTKEAKATAFSNWPTEIAVGKSKEETLAKFKEVYAKTDLNPKKSTEVSFDIYSQSGTNGFFIGKKLGRNLIKVDGPFPTVKEARAYRNDHQAELVAKLEKLKEIPKVRRDTNNPRVGEDMRNGEDVAPALFGETFGFKGVEFGNWVEQKKRQRDLNDAFDALMDMAAILGVPPKALSLNGELGLAFGARGSGGVDPAAAHYERDYVAINLTKKEGAGSLGHEWWHALDNYFSRQRKAGVGMDMMTEALDVSLASRGSEFMPRGEVRKEMIQAFGEVMKAIRSTAIKARSSKLDGKRSKDYWTTSPEMSARAFESYLIAKLQDQNASNDYLANIVDEQTWKAAEGLGFELDDSYPYPTAGEIPAIRAGFDHFFETIQTKETDKGVAMFNAKSGARGDALDTATLDAVIDRVIAGSPSHFARETVITALLFADLPAPILAQAKQEGYDQHGRNASGHKLTGVTYDGKVYLVQENISSELGAEETLLHERIHQILHGGANDENGLGLRRKLNELYSRAGMRSGLDRLSKEIGIDLTGPLKALDTVSGRNHGAFIVEEFLAHAEGQRAYEQLPDRIVRAVHEFWGWFRNWLNKSGFVRLAESLGMKLDSFTKPDLAWMLKGVRESATAAGDKAIRFMTAYHGSPHDYDGFNSSQIGKESRTKADARVSASGDAVAQIQVVVDKFNARFKGAAELNIRVARTIADIPAAYRPSINAEGVFHDNIGTIWLVGMNLKHGNGQINAPRVFQVLMHEAVGHFGLSRMMGDRFNGLLNHVMRVAKAKGNVTEDIYTPGHPDYATVEAVRLRYPKASDKEIAQEVMARMAETDVASTAFGYVRAVIRQWLRDMARALGFDLNVSTAELKDLIAQASAYMRRGDTRDSAAEPSGIVAASQKVDSLLTPDAQTKNAQRWLHAVGLQLPEANTIKERNESVITEHDVVKMFGGSDRGMESRRAPNKGFDLADETKIEAFRRTEQDSVIRWEKVQEQIAEQGGTVGVYENVYDAMKRYPGRAAEAISRLSRDKVEPLLKRAATLKASLDEIGTYLYALHAKDRNAYISGIRDDMPANGSGLSNGEADMILADYRAHRPDFAEFDKLARDFQELTNEKQAMLVKNGVLSQDQADAMTQAMGATYVPLKGFERIDESGQRQGNGTGNGYSTGKKLDKRAYGRVSRAGNIVENIIRDFERAILVSEKAVVGKYVRRLAEANPDASLWTVDQPEKQPQMGSNGKVVMMPSQMLDQEGEIQFIENGKPVRIQLHDPLLARAYNNLGAERLSGLLKASANLNAVLRQFWTAKNPAFFLINPIRDIQTMPITMTGEEGGAFALKALTKLPAAFKAAWAHERNETAGLSNEWRDVLSVYGASGARTGAAFVDAIESKALKLQELLQRQSGDGLLEHYRQYGARSTARLAAIKVIDNSVIDFIEHLNGAFENMTRLAVFKAYLDQHGGLGSLTGKPRAEVIARASKLAKNATVDFNTRGEKGQERNALYLFWNASVQGTTNVAKSLTTAKHRQQVWGIVGSLVVAGFVLGMMAGDDDDLIDENVKERNLTFRLKDALVKLPLAYGYSAFMDLGRLMADVANGRKDTLKASLYMMSSLLANFSPLGDFLHGGEGDTGDFALSFAPTVLKPGVMVGFNRGPFGNQVMPDYPGQENKPDREKMFRSTRGGIYDWLANGPLHWADVSPESIKLWTNYILGGTGRTIADAVSTGKWLGDGGFDVEKVPVLNKFVSTVDVEEYRSRFYQQLHEAEKASDRYKALFKSDPKTAAIFLKENRQAIEIGSGANQRMKLMGLLRDKEDAARNGKDKKGLAEWEVKQIQFAKELDARVKAKPASKSRTLGLERVPTN